MLNANVMERSQDSCCRLSGWQKDCSSAATLDLLLAGKAHCMKYVP